MSTISTPKLECIIGSEDLGRALLSVSVSVIFIANQLNGRREVGRGDEKRNNILACDIEEAQRIEFLVNLFF